MTSSRTVKTLAYLVAAMTAVTFVLSLLEPWAVSLRPREARAGQEMLPATLSAVRQPAWQHIELVLAAQESGRPPRLPQAHLVIRPDGAVETTALYEAARPLPNQVLRVCAVYQGRPSDNLLRAWLDTCDRAADRFGADLPPVRLKTMPQMRPSAARAGLLADIQRRLTAMLDSR